MITSLTNEWVEENYFQTILLKDNLLACLQLTFQLIYRLLKQ